MSNKTHKILQPEYMKKFQCIGTDCEETCCAGWHIGIDKDTYKKYRECPDKELRKQLKTCVTRVRTDNASDANYAKVRLKEDGFCPLLDSDKLCLLQRKLGEEYLSVTCAVYPRLIHMVNGVNEKALSLSCPEAARVALLNPELMAFEEGIEEARTRNEHSHAIEIRGDINTRNFWNLRIFIIALLQNRKYKLWQRLVILGLFCRSLEQNIQEDNGQDIPELIATYFDYLDKGVFLEELNAIPDAYTIQMKLMKEVADYRLASGISPRHITCFAQFLEGVQYTAENTVEQIGQHYTEAYNNYYQPFMAEREYILENYLVNDVFTYLFPFGRQKSVFDNYVLLAVKYAMIKMFLIGMAGVHKENFSTEHVIMLISSLAKMVSHDDYFLQNVAQLLKDSNFNTMPYMAILVKN